MKKIVYKLILVFILIFVGLIVILAIDDAKNYLYPHRNRVIFLNVGQGDSILLQTQAGINILVDGGPDNTVVYRLGKYIPFYDPTIDLLILTHPDSDHTTGLVEVMRRYQIKQIITTGVKHDLPAYQQFWQEVVERSIPVKNIIGQTELDFESLELRFYWPEENFWQENYTGEINDTSIVFRATYDAEYSFLLTGDLSSEKELELVEKYDQELISQVLKFGHHGSKNSSADEFIRTVDPVWGIVSAGEDNFYGHPHFRVIKHAVDQGIIVLTTGNQGDIEFDINDEIELKKY